MRRFALWSTIFLLAGVPGFGQIIPPGVGYPGGRRRYPQPPPQQSNPTALIVGMLRKIEDKDVIVEADDDRKITTITIAGSTKYVNASGGKAMISDFQPGDHVSVRTNQDNSNVYHGQTMTMVREGTPDDHSLAAAATKDTSRPITAPTSNSSSSGDSVSNNPDHPVLRRAGSSSGSTTNNSSGSTSSDSSGSNSSGAPTLRRAAPRLGDADNSSSSSSDAPGAVASDAPGAVASDAPGAVASNAPSAASSSDDEHPRLRRPAVSNPDDTPQAQIEPVGSSTTAAPAAPVLRRATPSGNTPAADPGTAGAEGRPSLQADDINGVRRMPQSIPGSGDPFIDQTREAAFEFSETLPNYIVKQYTTRYARVPLRRGGGNSWQALDTVTADVIEENGSEKYKNILINGKTPLRDVAQSGSWSSGEFSSLLKGVLSPYSNAEFHNKRATTIVNRPAFRYEFSVEQPNSNWHIEAESGAYMPGYTGSIWIDKENYRVLRIEMSARDLPGSFALDQVEWAVDYDYVPVAEARYLLPVHSESLSCARGTNACARNVIEFRNYRKFTADSTITFEP